MLNVSLTKDSLKDTQLSLDSSWVFVFVKLPLKYQGWGFSSEYFTLGRHLIWWQFKRKSNSGLNHHHTADNLSRPALCPVLSSPVSLCQMSVTQQKDFPAWLESLLLSTRISGPNISSHCRTALPHVYTIKPAHLGCQIYPAPRKIQAVQTH